MFRRTTLNIVHGIEPGGGRGRGGGRGEGEGGGGGVCQYILIVKKVGN